MKTILVTGATGVLAKRFISKFSSEFRIIRGLRNPTMPDEVQIDSWKEIETKIQLDAIVHFAGKYLVDDSVQSVKLVSDAVVGTATALANFCKIQKTPLIALGSYFELAPRELQPWSHYSIAKESAARILELVSLSHEIPMRYLYAYDTYGENLSRGKVVDVLLDSRTQELDLSLGEQKMNLTHEDDFVDAIKISLEDLISKGVGFSQRQIRNSKDEFSLRNIAEIVNSHRARKINLQFGAKPYRKKEVFNIWDCAPNLEGWSPRVHFEDFVSQKVGVFDEK